MAPRSAAGLLRIVKKPPGKRRSPGVKTTILFLTALAALGLLAMELSMLRAHSSSKQAVTKKKTLVQNLRRYAPGDDPRLVITSQPPSTKSVGPRAGSALLKGEWAVTDRLIGTAPTGITELLSDPPTDDSRDDPGEQRRLGEGWDGAAGTELHEHDSDLRIEEEGEAEALADMGIAADSPSNEPDQQGSSFSEPPIVQPLSGLKQHSGAYSVVSNRQRTVETHHEKVARGPATPSTQDFIFSGDLPGEDDYTRGVGRKVAAGQSPKSRASEAVARAKEKAAMAKARHGRG